MRFRSETVISALQGLERQIPDFRDHTRVVATALGRGDLAAAARASGDVRRTFDAINAATRKLKAEVIPADGLGNTLDSLPELVIRATRMVIAVQVSDLRVEIRGPAARDRARAMFAGRFQNIDDVASFVHEEFRRITAVWMRHRSGGSQAAAASESRVLYRAALRVAQHEVRKLGGDPDIACFLREGIARIDWPDVHRACALIVAAFNVDIDAEADRSLLAHSQPLHPSGAVTRKP